MTPRKVFEMWAGMDCQDFLIKSKVGELKSAINTKPKPSDWENYTYDDIEYIETELQIVKDYENTCDQVEDIALQVISDLCYDITNGKDLFELLENAFWDILPQDRRSVFYDICEKFDTGFYKEEEIKNMDDLAKDKDTFLALFGL